MALQYFRGRWNNTTHHHRCRLSVHDCKLAVNATGLGIVIRGQESGQTSCNTRDAGASSGLEVSNEHVPLGCGVEYMSQIGRPCKECGSPIDRPQGRQCRKCYNRQNMERRRRQFGSVAVRYRKAAPHDCTCGQIECDTCGDRMLQSLLDKRPPEPTEERSWVGVPQFT